METWEERLVACAHFILAIPNRYLVCHARSTILTDIFNAIFDKSSILSTLSPPAKSLPNTGHSHSGFPVADLYAGPDHPSPPAILVVLLRQ
jgi:hypothetical protein